MKEQNIKTRTRKINHLSFYLVMIVCMVMIGLACWFAYSQTKNQLVLDMESATDALDNIKVMEMETAVPKQTEEETLPEITTEQTLSEGIQELDTAPPETEPMQSVAAMAEAQTVTETTTTDTVSETDMTENAELIIHFTSTSPACMPLEGEIIESFSNGELVKSATTGIWQTHNGIDIAGTLGDAVCAMDKGVVQNVENDALWGVTVTINHQNGIYSRYCNLNSGVSVNAGDKVEAGTIIGALGDTADIESAMQTHLHFEVLQGDRYIDPVAYIGSTENTAESDTETTAVAAE